MNNIWNNKSRRNGGRQKVLLRFYLIKIPFFLRRVLLFFIRCYMQFIPFAMNESVRLLFLFLNTFCHFFWCHHRSLAEHRNSRRSFGFAQFLCGLRILLRCTCSFYFKTEWYMRVSECVHDISAYRISLPPKNVYSRWLVFIILHSSDKYISVSKRSNN